VTRCENWLEQNEKINGRGFITVPSANHDFQRPNCGPRNDRQLFVVWAFLLTWPGVPFIYYGDEIGMRFVEGLGDKEGSFLPVQQTNRAGSRTPMQWDNRLPNAGFSAAVDSGKLYLPVDPDPARPAVAEQHDDPGSLLNFVRKLIGLRKKCPALYNRCPVRVLTTDKSDYPLVYLREASGQRILTALNPSGASVTATVNLDAVSRIKPILTDKVRATLERGKMQLNMEGISFGIFDLDGSF
jgi:maltose alpha-D-glucosyltransferase/alpha-amylase